MTEKNQIEEMRKTLRGFFESHTQALQGLLDKLPEAAKKELQGLKDGLNEQLKKLGPIDQVPAALDANSLLQGIGYAIERVQTYANGLMDRLTGLTAEYAGKATALQGLEQQVQKGDLLTKEKVKEMCDAARDEGRKELQPVIAGMRKRQVELAGLPMPADDVLALNGDEFTKRFDLAVANAKTLKEKRGWAVGGKGENIVKELAWMGQQEFAGKLTTYEELIGTAGNGSGSGERKGGDPLLGGGPGTGTEKKEEKRRLRLV